MMPGERFADVAIVGGGVMGASIAAHLVERKAGRVVVFEREDLLGTGSTAKAAGGVRLQFTTAANVALSRYSIEEIRNFEERTGVDADFVQYGYLFLLNSEADLKRFTETAKVQRALGAPVEVITPEEAERILPGIRTEDLVGATFCGEDGVATPAALVSGYGSLRPPGRRGTPARVRGDRGDGASGRRVFAGGRRGALGVRLARERRGSVGGPGGGFARGGRARLAGAASVLHDGTHVVGARGHAADDRLGDGGVHAPSQRRDADRRLGPERAARVLTDSGPRPPCPRCGRTPPGGCPGSRRRP